MLKSAGLRKNTRTRAPGTTFTHASRPAWATHATSSMYHCHTAWCLFPFFVVCWCFIKNEIIEKQVFQSFPTGVFVRSKTFLFCFPHTILIRLWVYITNWHEIKNLKKAIIGEWKVFFDQILSFFLGTAHNILSGFNLNFCCTTKVFFSCFWIPEETVFQLWSFLLIFKFNLNVGLPLFYPPPPPIHTQFSIF